MCRCYWSCWRLWKGEYYQNHVRWQGDSKVSPNWWEVLFPYLTFINIPCVLLFDWQIFPKCWPTLLFPSLSRHSHKVTVWGKLVVSTNTVFTEATEKHVISILSTTKLKTFKSTYGLILSGLYNVYSCNCWSYLIPFASWNILPLHHRCTSATPKQCCRKSKKRCCNPENENSNTFSVLPLAPLP